jgi:hypothetical protein
MSSTRFKKECLSDFGLISIEILFLPKEFILFGESEKLIENIRKEFKAEYPLRSRLHASSDHHEVKARKKLIDREYQSAVKSLWHSYRIIKFGIQLAKYGCIKDYTEANDLWDILKEIPESDLTPDFFRSTYKKWVKTGDSSLLTEMKLLMPKGNHESANFRRVQKSDL